MTDTLKRFVSYIHGAEGQLEIKLLTPWDGNYRFDTFPASVRYAVRLGEFFNPTVEESHKLKTARTLSKDIYAAVLDDIMCQRAVKVVAAQNKKEREQKREEKMIYGDAVTPSWVRRLGQVIDSGRDR